MCVDVSDSLRYTKVNYYTCNEIYVPICYEFQYSGYIKLSVGSLLLVVSACYCMLVKAIIDVV